MFIRDKYTPPSSRGFELRESLLKGDLLGQKKEWDM